MSDDCKQKDRASNIIWAVTITNICSSFTDHFGGFPDKAKQESAQDYDPAEPTEDDVSFINVINEDK